MRGRVTSARGPRTAYERIRPLVILVMVPVVLAGIGSLVLEFGFDLPARLVDVLHGVQVAALVGLLAEPLLGALLAHRRSEVLLGRWFHFALAGAVAVAVGCLYASGLSDRGRWAIRVVQAAVALNLLMRLLELHRLLASLRVQPAILFLGSFLTLIAIGTILLLLPASTVEDRATSFTDALFTATSGVCVTGLIVQDTGTHWSPLGRYVILALIQLGGLGLMTFGSVFALLLWRGMRVRESVVMREVLRSEMLSEVGRLVIFILITTVAFEVFGAFLFSGLWDHTAALDPATGLPTTEPGVTFGERIEYSVFHSVSAFCNAGFCLYRRSLMDYRHAWQVNLGFPLLIVAGGMGFMVLFNVARLIRYRVRGWKKASLVQKRLRLQPRLALVTTAALLVAGTLFAFVFEALPGGGALPRGTTFPPGAGRAEPEPLPLDAAEDKEAPGEDRPMGEAWHEQLAGAWFLSVTARTAGFNTSDTRRLAPSTKFLTILLMFIGASPGSTGGGIKTVTFAVVVLGVWSALRGYGNTQAFRRTIHRGIVLRALTVLAVSVTWIAVVSLVVAAWGLRDGAVCTFLDVLFETTSAYATVGLSTGTTPLLNTLGRLLIVVTMYVGRVGPLTLFVAMPMGTARQRYDYPTENVAIS